MCMCDIIITNGALKASTNYLNKTLIMGIVIGSCVPDDEPESTERFHHVVYGKYKK